MGAAPAGGGAVAARAAVLGDGLARLRRRGGCRWGDGWCGRWHARSRFSRARSSRSLLGALGAIPAPRPPVSPAALPFDGAALEAVLASALVLVLAWLGWPALMRRLRLPVRPRSDAAALGTLLVLGGLTVVVWVFDPLTALLLVPP